MTKMKIHTEVFTTLIFALLLFIPNIAIAEIKTFEKEYTYQASEIDSKVTARAIAIELVKRLVLEELGTYLMAETEVTDFRLTKDKVVMFTAGIVQTEILNEKWDGEKYYIKAKIKADPNEVAASVDKLRKDREKTKELEDVKKKADDAFKEIARLKAELESVRADKNKLKEYAKAADTLTATDWFKKGLSYALKQNYDLAIEAFTSAIALNPNYARAYNNRGAAYANKGQYNRAIGDYNKAISLDPNDALPYIGRGGVYADKGHFEKALSDLDKAIALDPNSAFAYSNRGTVYSNKGYFDRAIEDFNKAISLDPNLAGAYSNRGLIYDRNSQYNKAIMDYNTAIALVPNDAKTYVNRGNFYANKGQYNRAVEDYSRAIALSPNDAIVSARAYVGRGAAYANKGNMNWAISDFQKACNWGEQLGCEYLQRALNSR